MIIRPGAGMVLICALALAACSKPHDNAYQGWVEANLIFVAPTKSGACRR
jgi:hypothetical protein